MIDQYALMTKGEKLAHVRKVLAPYQKYYIRGYSRDVLKILIDRGIKNPENGKDFTFDQIRHTRAGRVAYPELADVIAEVGRRNKEALAKMEVSEG